MKTHKRVYTLFWIAFGIYVVSLFLPYEIMIRQWDYVERNINAGEKDYRSGIDCVIPLFSLVPIALLVVFVHIKHSRMVKWFSLFFAIFLIVPVLPFYLLVITSCIFNCNSYPTIGFYLHCLASILFFVATIVKFRIPVERKSASSVDLLDDF